MSTAPSTVRKHSQPTGILPRLLHMVTRHIRQLHRTDPSDRYCAPTPIGIEGLPDGVGQLPRHVPVSLVAADKGSAVRWFPALLEDAIAQGPVALVSSDTEWIDALLLRPPLRDAYSTGRLALWVLLPGLQIEVQHHGFSLLLQELEQTGLKAEHALYVCGADPLSSLLSSMSVAQLARTSRQLTALSFERQRPFVLGFLAPREPEVLLPILRNLCQMSMHIAVVRSEADRWSLDLERWNADTGALFQTTFGLLHNDLSGRLIADGTRTRGMTRDLIEALDQSDVIATRASVEGQRGVPSHWRIVDNVADLEAAAVASVAATILIDAGYASEFEERARLVHQLRLSRPRTLKIVVRENLGKLRSHSEQALLQLGASAVLYKELGFSRVLQQLQDINTQTHARQVHTDYLQALNSFMPARERGYQTPAQFCQLVRDMLDRTHSIGLSHSLVQLTMLAQVPHLDALRACHTARDGDVFTADHGAIYVFLFACRKPDVEMALSRLFALPLTQLFASESTDCTDAGIRVMVGRLQEAVRKGLPGYSAQLQASPGPTVITMAPNLPVAPSSLGGLPAVPIHGQEPAMPAATQSMTLLHTTAGPSVQHRPIARRAEPRTSPGPLA